MQRRKLSDASDEADASSASSGSTPAKYRVSRPYSRPQSGLSYTDMLCIMGALALMMMVPMYAVASSLRFSASTLAAPLTGSRVAAAIDTLNGLFYGQASGSAVAVPGWKTVWADENRTRLAQVVTSDTMSACSRIESLLDPPTSGYKLCTDGHTGAFVASSSGSGSTGSTSCVVYSFSMLGEAGEGGLELEREAARRGCTVHVFSPVMTYKGEDVPSDIRQGMEVKMPHTAPAATTGSLTLHSILAAKDDYDPSVTEGRHPDTLRPEQLWVHHTIPTIMAALGHDQGRGRLSLLRITGYAGREWDALYTCVVDYADTCGAAIDNLQLEASLTDREHGLSSGEVELHALARWAAVMSGLVNEAPYGLGLKQVDRAHVRSGGTVALGISPVDPKVRESTRLAAALATSSSSVFDGRVARVVRTTYVRRPLDEVVRLGTGGVYTSAAGYTADRKAAFCSEAASLAKAEYGAQAVLNSPECPAPEGEAGQEAGQGEEEPDQEQEQEGAGSEEGQRGPVSSRLRV